MKYKHLSVYLYQGDTVEISFRFKTDIYLMNNREFMALQSGMRPAGKSGQFTHSPARLIAPASGNWHIVMFGGGDPADARQMVKVIPKRK
ncbi:DUF1883 domain-containing protein [Klebsiella pneumoniae]|uniref:DUF1883 domain-containing protein n=1 Tax=Klebsiella pneumoniae TaxID=573 RepID=UPI0020211FCE|nr:DUF1883 domain-containing protein [Klebsiella pneumoniae]MCL7695506.1 DUF1883 domain-containing protein [Klebsiella pneumoniae]